MSIINNEIKSYFSLDTRSSTADEGERRDILALNLYQQKSPVFSSEAKKELLNLIDIADGKGDTPIHRALKKGEVAMADHLGLQDYVDPARENQEGIRATQSRTLIERIKASCFYQASISSPVFEGIIEKYSIQKIEDAISFIEKEIVFNNLEMPAYSMDLLKNELKYAHPFKGEPILVGFVEKEGIVLPKIRWEDSPKSHTQTSTGVKCLDVEVKEAFEKLPVKRLIEDERALKLLFAFLKKTPFPSKNIEDGCVERAHWISFVLGQVLKYKCERIQAYSPQGRLFDVEFPFPLETPRWGMHVAVVVHMEEANAPFVFDTALSTPLPLDAWKKAIAGNYDLKAIKWMMRKNRNLEEDLSTSLHVLRLYYLDEHDLSIN
jgi:hypothetical protein